MYACAFMWDDRVREGASHDPRPGEFLLGDSGGGADVGFRIEAPSQPASDLANRSHHRRVEALGAHSSETGVAFDTLVLVDRRPFYFGINVDRPHRTDRHAISAGDAFLGINNHSPLRSQTGLFYIGAASGNERGFRNSTIVEVTVAAPRGSEALHKLAMLEG
jgi:hypothetical protein